MTATPQEPNNEFSEIINETPLPKGEAIASNKSKKKKWLIVVSVFLSLIIAFISAFFIVVKIGEDKLRKEKNLIQASANDLDDLAVYHNDKAYYYKKSLINILLIGVDRESTQNSKRGQADALYLASIDIESNIVKVISISRNTMCKVNVLGSDGKAYSTENQQICLSYAYGKDDKNASVNTAKSVSDLMYNIPINGYYTIYFDTLADIVNSIGGVNVTIPNGNVPIVFENSKGKNIRVYGTDALTYLRMREDSNAPRVERHKAFINSFVSSAKSATKKDLTLPIKLVNKFSKESVTNIKLNSLVYLAKQAINWNMEQLSVKGTYGSDGKYETFTVDEEALRELVLNNFYYVKNN